MRTTITLDPDVAEMVQSVMRDQGVSLTEAVNSALRAALRPRPTTQAMRTQTFRLGTPRIDITHATRLAGALDDDEIVRAINTGK